MVQRRDIPILRRVRWAVAQATQRPNILRLLRLQQKQPRYDSFFPVRDVWAAAVRLSEKPGLVNLRDAAIVLMRMVTLGRSGDLSAMLPMVFYEESRVFVRWVAKGSCCRSFVISGLPFRILGEYLVEERAQNPGPHEAMFVGLGKPTVSPEGNELQTTPLSSERLAKVSLRVMEQAGIDTKSYKSHALRGACATEALALGVNEHAVRLRGGWRGGASFDTHYGRSHQLINWSGVWAEGCVGLSATGEHVQGFNVAPAPSLSLEAPSAEDDEGSREERERGEERGLGSLGDAGADAMLDAQTLQNLIDVGAACPASGVTCPTCVGNVKWEAAWVCVGCVPGAWVHLCCLSVHVCRSAIKKFGKRNPVDSLEAAGLLTPKRRRLVKS